ncbi:MAG: B12-binding domain-containing radical SAM protein [Candidatus Nealsonbacteria bacterium]
MKVLLLYPKFPKTFWGFEYALPFIGKKSSFPPLGLLTVASLLPKDWDKRLIDLNVQNINEKDVQWADFVLISAMIIQKESVREIINISKNNGKKIIAGGPLFTTGFEEFLDDIDHFILGEAEATLPLFLDDFKNGNAKKIYKSDQWPDISKSPVPLWELIDKKNYASMGIQLSRGCPFNCEFCDIVLLNGRFPRTKNENQLLNELDVLYQMGWRGSLFFVDDNFIGNKIKLKKEILPTLISWMEERKYPFSFLTQVSINLADDEELMNLMAKAGFDNVFIGIETPKEESLKECGKFQNLNRDLLGSIKVIQNHGMQVQAGFIIGFDQDAQSIFDRMILFIQTSGIATAMVGILQALPKTKLWKRMEAEGRLISQASADTDGTINFKPKMDFNSLVSGYQKIISHLYSPKYYYQRLLTFLKEYNLTKRKKKKKIDLDHLFAFLKSIFVLGIKEKERSYYWKLFFWTLFKKPTLFPMTIELIIKGFHFRKISESYVSQKTN